MFDEWTKIFDVSQHRESDGSRVVVELGFWRDGFRKIRIRKFGPSGQPIPSESMTIDVNAWNALRGAA